MTERIRRRADGCPALTKRQTERAHSYAVEIVVGGTSRRRVSLQLLAAALCEVTAYARGMVRELALLRDTSITIGTVPKSIVLDMALSIAQKLGELPDNDARDAYLRALLGDDEDTSPVVAPSSGRTH
jgi:hypothetical protein